HRPHADAAGDRHGDAGAQIARGDPLAAQPPEVDGKDDGDGDDDLTGGRAGDAGQARSDVDARDQRQQPDQLHGEGIGARDLGARVAVPIACGIGVGAMAVASQGITSLNWAALGIAGIAVLGALALQGRSIQAALRRLRSVLSDSAGERRPPTAAVVAGAVAATPTPAAST
ncbi:MAG: hypothetical protein QOJ85_4507, partial [Solirubrobacteraceae bacterium]|nr:hypothetical protein [Solirubrobacteraceae bacterium]